MAAQQVQPLTKKHVYVIPTRTVAQGISAMLVFDPESEPEVNMQEMEQAAQGVRTGEITYAARNSVFEDREIHEGDFLALLDGKLVDVQTRQLDAVRALAQSVHQFDGISYITVIYGADTDEEHAQKVGEIFSSELDDIEVSIIHGGQPVYAYIISAE